MVDVAAKPDTKRRAVAKGILQLRAKTLEAIRDRKLEKGDALEIARTAAILAAKHTPSILPLCHPLPLTAITVDFDLAPGALHCTVTVETTYKTGVEMEALTACATALLTIWDVVKPLEKDKKGQYPSTVVQELRVVEKEKA